MPIDASIPLQARNNASDPAETFGRMVQLKALMGQGQLQDLQTQQLRRSVDNEQTLSEVYRGAIGPDGTVNRQAVLTGAAQRGLGSKIPSMQEGFAKVDKEQTEVDKNRATTKETELKMVKQKLEIAGGMINSLLSIPDVTADHVVQKVSQLVQQGLIPQDEGVQMIRQVPGNPVALRQFLLQKGMEVMDADKRLALLTPKIEYRDTGKQQVPVDLNAITNPNPAALTKTTTPGEDLSASTTRRGQNMTDDRERALAAQSVTYQDTPDGVVALPSKFTPGSVPKASAVLAPGSGMQPLQGKNSMTEDQGKATGWLMQANNSYGNMLKILGVDAGAATPGIGDAVAAIPGGGAVGNYLRSSNRQQFNQSASSLSESLLRAATGAGINAHEAEQKVREITPQWGDTEANIKQKMDAIPIYLESLKVRAGPGAKKAGAAAASSTPAPGAIGSGNFQVGADIDAILKKHGGR
jgi:hypothetical protein